MATDDLGLRQRPPRVVSMKHVAARAGVSLGIVSNFLTRPDLVGEATRVRVERAVESLGFVRNESARQLRSGISGALADAMLNWSNPFFSEVDHAVEQVVESADLSLYRCNYEHNRAR